MNSDAVFRSLVQLLAVRWSAQPPDAIERLVQGTEDGHAGVWIDKLGPLCVVSVYEPALAMVLPACEVWLRELASAGVQHLILKLRDPGTSGFTYQFSTPDLIAQRFLAREGACRFEIRCDPRDDFGVFPDAAGARQLVAELAPGKTVLNLFAYTCGFAIAAARAGAKRVTNIDASKDMLTWGKRNAELNAIDFAVVPDTAQKYLRRLRERHARGTAAHFDLIILDPPAFGVGRGDERILRKAWPEFLNTLVALAPEHVLLAFNDLAYRRTESIEDLVDQHFDPSWRRHWFDWRGTAIQQPDQLHAAADPYFAPPVFLHLQQMQRPVGSLAQPDRS